ncbi:MAG: pyridoxal-phosphate dependent enzyme [Chitinophagaceae bacterium]|nr:MAG: pyridoxal-phosphate dependent enzyme [Chitinophagaceae bacterium]
MPAISNLTKLINCEAVMIQPLMLKSCEAADVSLDIMRLDLIHPVISGNKYFKLKVSIVNALSANMEGIVSFGGAYSNHLVALACLCNAVGLKSIGVIRGEKPAVLSPTLNDAISYGLKPVFVSRESYSDMKQLTHDVQQDYPSYKMVPEGGRSAEGIEGVTEIFNITDTSDYDVIACAVGTGTMFAGLLKKAELHQELIGISSLKMDPGNDVEAFIHLHSQKSFNLFYNYHFGGYAKKTIELIDFMNQLWLKHGLPTDFVYTAKLLFGLNNLIEIKYFKPGTKILAIHSGGLQGNRSIADKLVY